MSWSVSKRAPLDSEEDAKWLLDLNIQTIALPYRIKDGSDRRERPFRSPRSPAYGRELRCRMAAPGNLPGTPFLGHFDGKAVYNNSVQKAKAEVPDNCRF
jgi:hypothetical protein